MAGVPQLTNLVSGCRLAARVLAPGPAVGLAHIVADASQGWRDGRVGIVLVVLLAMSGTSGEDKETSQQARQSAQATAATSGAGDATPGQTATTASRTPTPEPTPSPTPTAQAVASPTFVVNSQPVGCHAQPAADAPVVAQRAIGTVQAMDLFIRLSDGTWHHEVADGCWTRTSPGPVRSFNTLQEAERFALSVRPTPPPTPTPPSFGSGTKIVGTDIPPSTYRTRSGSAGCYWARLSGFGGTLSEIIANENENGPAVVTIAPTDKGVQSTRCGTWTQDLSPITPRPDAPFKDGTYIVRTDIAPGTWRSEGGTNCYWARLSGFGGTLREIIANDNAGPSTVVQIGPNDAGFKSSRCGTWTKIG